MNDARHIFSQKLPDRIYVRTYFRFAFIEPSLFTGTLCALPKYGFRTPILTECLWWLSTVLPAHLSGKNADRLISEIATVWSENGSGLRLLAEAIQPLIGPGLHCSEVQIEDDSPNISFAEVTYHNTAFRQYNGVTQTILFGRPTQSIYYQTHPSARALPEYLLDGVSFLVLPTRNEELYTPDVRRFAVPLLSG